MPSLRGVKGSLGAFNVEAHFVQLGDRSLLLSLGDSLDRNYPGDDIAVPQSPESGFEVGDDLWHVRSVHFGRENNANALPPLANSLAFEPAGGPVARKDDSHDLAKTLFDSQRKIVSTIVVTLPGPKLEEPAHARARV